MCAKTLLISVFTGLSVKFKIDHSIRNECNILRATVMNRGGQNRISSKILARSEEITSDEGSKNIQSSSCIMVY